MESWENESGDQVAARESEWKRSEIVVETEMEVHRLRHRNS